MTSLVITGHDYRTPRKANMHFITRELATRGPARMFSMGFSPLSEIRGRDPRNGLNIARNRVEHHNGVDCYLWWAPLHPFNLEPLKAAFLSPLVYEAYRVSAPAILQEWAAEADTILIESGLGVLFLRDLRRWAPSARILYIASDDLETISCDPYLTRLLNRDGRLLDGARVPSKLLCDAMPKDTFTYYVPHGMDLDLLKDSQPNPFEGGLNAVAVGSMLFDTSFFEFAARRFPEVTFHAIGSGKPREAFPKEVRVYPEMPHKQTIPYLRYADFGIAPYRKAKLPYYLGDTSMKLLQYGVFGLPAVCPTFALGSDKLLRFGYEPGDNASIQSAVEAAIAAGRGETGNALSWSEVTDRLLNPRAYSDTVCERPGWNSDGTPEFAAASDILEGQG